MTRQSAASSDDCIAVVGLACRLPGARNAEQYWRNLCAGVESIHFFDDAELLAAGVPAEVLRDPQYVKAAPLIDDVDMFDAGFFGYSPREASLMDPQQRLFLEVAWQAFEDAGYAPESLREVVGVFAGAGGNVTSYMVAHSGYAGFPGQTGGLEHISNDKDFLSTRISYKLDLTGPSMTVQTACSTSLVALHLACQSLHAGECDLALAGASTIRIPHASGYFAPRGGIYSSDGRCRAFDANGTGTIFGSGVAAVLLKPLADAQRDGDHVHAVIRGTAVTNDGGRKVSYTAPSVVGEARAMVEALALADVPVNSVRFVECHATGTTVGDPLEIQALTRAFRTYTDEQGFCAVGSAKANIGHAEQAAGMAGLIKTILALENSKIPPTRVETRNPEIPFAGSPFFLNSELIDWPGDADTPRRAAVNSLGIGGTNAFAVLEQAPAAEPSPTDVRERDVHLLCLSARTEDALRVRAGQFAEVLARSVGDGSLRADDVCHTANISRTQFGCRLALAGTTDELRQRLEGHAAGGSGAGATSRDARSGEVAFLFSGQGFQHVGMARGLYESEPIFRQALAACDALLSPHLPHGLLEVLFAEDDKGLLLDRTGFTQPALFAIEYALAELWRSWGIVPAAVMGHSVGEITAACVAGVMDLEAAAHLIHRRAALMQQLPGGGMLSVFGAEQAVRAVVESTGARVSIAAVNSPRNTVVSGPAEVLADLRQALLREGLEAKPLVVSHAFHSALMEPMLADLTEVARGIEMRPPSIPLVSNVTGAFFDAAPEPEYWSRHAREAVRFADGMRTLAASGHSVFVEIGPGAGLLSLGRLCLSGEARAAGDGAWVPSLDRRRPDEVAMRDAVGRLYLAGKQPDWSALGRGCRRVPLPTYPFERRRHWLQAEALAPGAFGGRIDAGAEGGAIAAPDRPESVFERDVVLGSERLRLLREHRIHGDVVFPTAFIVSEVLDEGAARLGGDVEIVDLRYHRALVLPWQNVTSIKIESKLRRSTSSSGELEFRLLARHGVGDGDVWQQHATGRLLRATGDAGGDAGAGRARTGTESWRTIPTEVLYRGLAAIGLDYGDAFRAVRELRAGEGEVVSQLEVRAAQPGVASEAWPLLLDACLHGYPVLTGDCPDVACEAVDGARQCAAAADIYLPTGFERLRVNGRRAEGEFLARAVLRSRAGADEDRADEGRAGEDPADEEPADGAVALDLILERDGETVLELTGLSLNRVPPQSVRAEREQPLQQWLVDLQWVPSPRGDVPQPPPPPGTWLLLADEGGVAVALAERLQSEGHRCHLIRRAEQPPVDGYGELLRDLAGDPAWPLLGVVHAFALDHDDPERHPEHRLDQALQAGLASAFGVVKAVLASAASAGPARIWIATRDAVATGGDAEAVRLAPPHACLWGFGRTVELESPRHWGGLIDLGAHAGAAAGAMLADEILTGDGETQVALRADQRLAARLSRWREPAESTPRPLRRDGACLITGGLGMIGLRAARALVADHGIARVVLVGRSAPGEHARRAIAEIEALGAGVVVLRADISRFADAERVVAEVRSSHGPLRGVVHCAGVLADGILSQTSWPEFARGLAPKVRGGWFLDALTADCDLDLFVVHSSLLSWTGSVGQSNYTAGNAFLDALVDDRRARGLPALGINWGPWAEAGMATASGRKGEEIWRRLGISYIAPQTGDQVQELLLARGARHAGLAIADWQRFVAAQPASARLLERLLVVEGRDSAVGSAAVGSEAAPPLDWRQRIGAAKGGERRELLVQALCVQASAELGFDEPISRDQSLAELGLDSLISVNLANRVESALGVSIPLVHLVQGPSVADLVDRIAADLDLDGAAAETPSVTIGPVVAPPTIATSGNGTAVRAQGVEGAARRSPGRWLVFPKPNPAARIRLFCFPYAGAGAPVYQSWAASLDPSIELVAVEPPGRAGRVEEPAVRSMKEFLAGLMPDLRRYLDKPVALFGHCQGAMNVHEVATVLLQEPGAELRHLFVSGARPPHRLFDFGSFEETLADSMLAFDEYDPIVPLHAQADEVFAAALRHFDIGATDQFLDNDDLRGLLMPAVRADFETLADYRLVRKAPWPVPITCLVGLADTYVSRADAIAWSEYTDAMFRIEYFDSTHYLIVEQRDGLIEAINDDLTSSRRYRSRRNGAAPDASHNGKHAAATDFESGASRRGMGARP